VANSAPTAPTIANQTATAGAAWSFTVPAFTDPNGDALTYTVTGLPSWMSFNATTRVLSGTSTAVGSWTVTVTATDPAGATVSKAFTVTTPNMAPVAGTIPAQSMARNVASSLSVAGYFTDANGDALTFTATGLPAGLAISTAGVISGTPTAALGNVTVTVTAADGRGGTVSKAFTLTIANTAPTAPAIANQTAAVGAAWSFTAPAFSDANGDALTYTISGMPSWMSFNASTRVLSGTPKPVGTWTITLTATDPSGAAVSKAFKVTTPNVAPTAGTVPNQSLARNIAGSISVAAHFADANGDALTFTASGLPTGLSISAAGVISGTPTAALGAYTVTVTAADGRGGTVSKAFTLTVANSAPTAPTIANQTATAGAAWSFTIPAFTDPNGDALTYTVTGLPSWMSFNATTRVLSGAAKPAGSWTITVTATDPSNAAISKSFTVTTPNVAPVVAAAIPAQTASRNITWSYQIPAGTFSDINGDTLTYSVTGLPAGITFTAATRTLSGKATVAPGAYTLVVTAADGNGGTRATNLVLNVTNSVPKYAGTLVARTAQNGESVNWVLPAGAFTDPNGDALTYSLMVQRPGYQETYWEPKEAAWMVRWIEPEWITVSSPVINASTGAITGVLPLFYAPVSPVNGTGGGPQPRMAIRITATDSYGASVSGEFSADINVAPKGSSPGNKTIKSNVAWSLTVPAFTDDNNDALTYSISGLPAGLSFNATTRVISGAVATAGAYTITITANDGKGGVGSTSFVLTVQANTAPTAPTIPNQTGTVGTAYSYQIPAFSDADNDVLTYSASGLPAGMYFNASTRTLSGTPTTAATSSIVITATDGRGGSVSKTFSMTVSTAVVPNRAPVVNKQAASPSYHFYSTNRWVVYPEGFTLPADSFKDPDNNPLTYTVIQKPAWLSYSYSASSGHGFSGVYNGSSNYSIHNITIRATDPSGAYVDMTFTVSAEYDYNDPTNPTDPRRVVLSEPQEFVASDELLMVEDLEQPQAGTVAALTAPAANIQESWYSYSKLNQMVVSGGVLENGLVVAKKDYSSYANVYDAAGNAIAQTQWRSNGAGGWRTTITHHSFSLRGELLLTFNEVDLGGTVSPGVIERRTYDDAGRTTQVLRYYTPGQLIHWVDWERTPMRTNVGGMLYSAEQTSYDDDGRVLRKVMRERPSETMSRAPIGSNAEWTFPEWIYLLGLETPASQYSDVSVLTETTMVTYTDGNNGYDEAGRVKTYSYHGKGYIHTYNYAYTGWDSYREQSVTGTSTSNSYKTTTTISTYDNGGRQTELREKTVGVTMDDRVRSFALDGNGQIISRRDGTVTSGNVFQQKNAQGQAATGNVLGYMNQRNVYANGQQVAGLNEGGKIDVLSRLTAFSNSDAGKTQVVVQAGDTLRSVAQRIYGNENLWYIIAEANALSSDGDLVAGASLTVPEVKTSSNDANTFKPYNPSEITGPTTPSLPYVSPPPAHQCKALVSVLSTVVSYVVGAIVGYFAGPYVGAAAQGAVKAHSQQVFQAMADGNYDWGHLNKNLLQPFGGNSLDHLDPLGTPVAGGIDYKAVGVSAGVSVATYAASAFANANDFGQYGTVAAQAATSYAANYQFSKWAGYDVSWNNRQFITTVGAAVVGESRFGNTSIVGVGKATTGAGLTGAFSWREVAIAATDNVLRSGIEYGIGKAVRSPSANWNTGTVLADAFGNALGSALGSSIDARLKRGDAPADAMRYAPFSMNIPEMTDSDYWDRWLSSGGEGDLGDLGDFAAVIDSRTAQYDDAAYLRSRTGTSKLTASHNSSYGLSISSPGGYASMDGRTWPTMPSLSQVTPLENLETGLLLSTTPKVEVRPDPTQSQEFFDKWRWAGSYNMPAPLSASREYMALYGSVMDSVTRPAWNQNRAEIQAFYRSQKGFGTYTDRGSLIYRRDDLRDVAAMGGSLVSVVAPTAKEAWSKGAMPSAIELYTGQWKYLGNTAIDLWNLGVQVTPLTQGLMRFAGMDPTISRFDYTPGELTVAGLTEVATLGAGGIAGLVKGTALPTGARSLRGLEAAERWRDVANSAPSQLYRLGRPASPLEKTFDHALSPQLYVEDVATHYGISLRGSGQPISVVFDETLGAGKLGVTYAAEGGKVIRIGPDALVDQATTANTIAHELSHARDYLRGVHKPHGLDSSIGDRTVYGSGNALEAWIKGHR